MCVRNFLGSVKDKDKFPPENLIYFLHSISYVNEVGVNVVGVESRHLDARIVV